MSLCSQNYKAFVLVAYNCSINLVLVSWDMPMPFPLCLTKLDMVRTSLCPNLHGLSKISFVSFSTYDLL